MVSKIHSLSFVTDVVPQYRGSAQLNSQGNTLNTSILSMDPQKISVMYPSISFIEGSTTRQNDPSAMIVGYGVANPAGSSSPLVVIGQSVKTTFTYIDSSGNQQRESKSFVVTGITALSGNDQIDRLVVINQAAGDSFFHKSGKYDGLIVVAQSSEYLDPIQQEIKRLYGNTIGLTTPQSALSLREQFTNGNNAFILSIGMIALIVGAVGIITTLYTSVTERIKEIGTMKAIGAQNRTILALFLVEALLIGIIGATAGSAIGVGGGYFLSSFLFGSIPGPGSITITPVFLPEDLAKVWGLSVILSIGAGLYPAWKASQLSPMVALRRE